MKRVLVLAMTLMLTVIGCDSGDGGGGDGGTTATSAAVGGEETVEIADLAFAPDELTVAVGSEVTWVNNDTVAHTATSDDDVFDSGNLDEGQEFSFTFDEAGTFSYVCEIHPTMTGTIVVE